MKKLLLIAIAACLLLWQPHGAVNAQQTSEQKPPIEQVLVREGDYAVDLVEALNLGVARNETEAESTLTALGIAPRNGWIADYPMTPDITLEVENAAGMAASSGKLKMGEGAAEQAVERLSAKLGFPVTAAGSVQSQNWSTQNDGAYAEPIDYSNPSSYSEPIAYSNPAAYPDSIAYSNPAVYPDPTVINNYYYETGPPVVTYYTPPWDYSYLYSWVPFPFWCGGFFYGGYYMLNDFDRRVTVHRHFNRDNVYVNRFMNKEVTNHIAGNRPGRFARVDPIARSTGNSWRTFPTTSPTRGFNTGQAQNSAQSIFTRSMGRTPSAETGNLPRVAEPGFRNAAPLNSAGRLPGPNAANRNPVTSSFSGRGGDQVRTPSPQRSLGAIGNGPVTPPGGRNFGATARSSGFENRGQVSISPSLPSNGGSFSSPRLSGGGPSGGFHASGGFPETFRSSGNSLGGFPSGRSSFQSFSGGAPSVGGFHGGGGSSGTFHGGGGSFGGFHGGSGGGRR